MRPGGVVADVCPQKRCLFERYFPPGYPLVETGMANLKHPVGSADLEHPTRARCTRHRREWLNRGRGARSFVPNATHRGLSNGIEMPNECQMETCRAGSTTRRYCRSRLPF